MTQTLDTRSLTGQHIFDHIRWEVEQESWLETKQANKKEIRDALPLLKRDPLARVADSIHVHR